MLCCAFVLRLRIAPPLVSPPYPPVFAPVGCLLALNPGQRHLQGTFTNPCLISTLFLFQPQTVQIMPPSLVVVAWAALGSTKAARDFLAEGPRGLRGIKPGLPIAVVGGEKDGEVPSTMKKRRHTSLVEPLFLRSQHFPDRAVPALFPVDSTPPSCLFSSATLTTPRKTHFYPPKFPERLGAVLAAISSSRTRVQGSFCLFFRRHRTPLALEWSTRRQHVFCRAFAR